MLKTLWQFHTLFCRLFHFSISIVFNKPEVSFTRNFIFKLILGIPDFLTKPILNWPLKSRSQNVDLILSIPCLSLEDKLGVQFHKMFQLQILYSSSLVVSTVNQLSDISIATIIVNKYFYPIRFDSSCAGVKFLQMFWS